ncbi:glycoside hydrolase family 97 protein [Novosphingopyxis baekryungensis]|uniref:glycoside hydrolase family 97 protein n=1 Tax=Novosphingopyxis baekryungensis TaxID=279369 RepID=UPI0003B398FB|nr:glycoside hydrolase family 97 protein [Novosphingopyxis baekryungensis]
MRSILAALPALSLLFSAPALAEEVASASSPDGHITVSIDWDGEGHFSYAIARDGTPLIENSRLGFLMDNAPPISRFLELADVQTDRADMTWEQPWGENRQVRDNHIELSLELLDTAFEDRSLTVRFRLFDDGVGFRYEFPESAGRTEIAEELTEFNIAQPGTAWWIRGGDWNRYEYLYDETPIDAVGTAHTPITFKLADGTHLAFHEAALVDYAGMWMRRMDGRRFRAELSPGSGQAKVVRDGAFTTPWRTIRIAKDAAGLYDNNIDLNLNEPNKLGDVGWVKPYKYVGIWWAMHLNEWTWNSGPDHGATTQHAKDYIDFAAENGFRGVLIEGWNKGWDGNWFGNGSDFSFTEAYPDFDIEEVTRYGLSKGVHLVGHHETGGNIAVYEPQLEDAMALYERLGVDSVKTGYVADAGGVKLLPTGDAPLRYGWHDGQEMARHHLKVVETAARHRIAVNPHEPIKDTGLRRTYPNWVSREGARGMEYQAWGVPGNIPSHVPSLIFSRMLSGPMDYTPGVLSLKGRDGRDLPSTIARQLALYLVLYSPIQMAADLPENYARYPDAFAFIKQVPTDWEESHVLQGEVADYAVMARKERGGQDWYVGGVTDENARSVSVSLDFLDADKSYTATIYRDGADADYRTETRHSIAIESKPVQRGDMLDLTMAPGGGFAVRLTPVG